MQIVIARFDRAAEPGDLPQPQTGAMWRKRATIDDDRAFRSEATVLFADAHTARWMMSPLLRCERPDICRSRRSTVTATIRGEHKLAASNVARRIEAFIRVTRQIDICETGINSRLMHP